MRHYAALSREQIRAEFAAFCAARAGRRQVRAPRLRWAGGLVAVDEMGSIRRVAYMLHAGVPLLIDAGLHLPALHAGDSQRVALEGLPGLLARELLGARSYKSDEPRKQNAERLIARKDLLDALEQGRSRLGLRLRLSHAQRDALVADASGDRLDAVLCLVQAAWAAGQAGFGRPADADPLEGWIVSSGIS
jgi:hypothetical protein